MKRIAIHTAAFFAFTIAYASQCPNGDKLLRNNTPLTSVCPNGFDSRNHNGSIEQSIARERETVAMIIAAAEQAGIPPDIALAVSYHESMGFRSCAGSQTGVLGPMQLTRRTGRGYGYDRDILEQNIRGGVATLRDAYRACGMDYACLASRYNGSTPAEQASWTRGVQNAHRQLQNNPALAASACQGSTQACDSSPGDFPTTPVAASPPPPSPSDVIVSTNDI